MSHNHLFDHLPNDQKNKLTEAICSEMHGKWGSLKPVISFSVFRPLILFNISELAWSANETGQTRDDLLTNK